MLAESGRLAEVADEPVVGIHEPVAGSMLQLMGAPRGAGRDAREGRQALQARGLAASTSCSTTSSRATSSPRAGCTTRSASVEGLDEQTQEESRLLHAPVHRCAGAVELRADQSRSVPRDGRDRRAEPGQGPQQPARRHRARQRPAPDLDDRPEGVRARRQHRDHAGQGRVPERAHAADPVRAVDAEGLQAAAADHSAVDQQVLHPRPAREELVHQAGRSSRA